MEAVVQSGAAGIRQLARQRPFRRRVGLRERRHEAELTVIRPGAVDREFTGHDQRIFLPMNLGELMEI